MKANSLIRQEIAMAGTRQAPGPAIASTATASNKFFDFMLVCGGSVSSVGAGYADYQ